MALNPFWGKGFWTEVHAEDCRLGFQPALRGALIGAGYVGSATLGVPPDSLESELATLAQSGGPPHGAGGGLLAAGGDGGSLAPSDVARWDQRLDPLVRRAAPEIYRNLRSAGSSSCRDWLIQQIPQERKRGTTWTDLWTLGAAVDYRLAQERGEQAITIALATDDILETQLRRLAAYVYEVRSSSPLNRQPLVPVVRLDEGGELVRAGP